MLGDGVKYGNEGYPLSLYTAHYDVIPPDQGGGCVSEASETVLFSTWLFFRQAVTLKLERAPAMHRVRLLAIVLTNTIESGLSRSTSVEQ